MGTYALFKDRLSPVRRLEVQLKHTKRDQREAELQAQLNAFQIAEYQQELATLLPEAKKGKSFQETYRLRQLASVVSSETKNLQIERASGLFEEAKGLFRQKLYKESNLQFLRLIQLYPQSVHLVEAHFLLVEGLYQVDDFEAAIETIEKMLDLFPESVLTGFALLRLGKIFESHDRLEDAIEVYRAIESNYQNPDLLSQARASLKAVAL